MAGSAAGNGDGGGESALAIDTLVSLRYNHPCPEAKLWSIICGTMQLYKYFIFLVFFLLLTCNFFDGRIGVSLPKVHLPPEQRHGEYSESPPRLT